MERDLEARRKQHRDMRAMLSLACVLVLILAIETGHPRFVGESYADWLATARSQLLTSALSTSQRTYDQLRRGDLSGATRLAIGTAPDEIRSISSESIGSLPRPLVCLTKVGDPMGSSGVYCHHGRSTHDLLFILDPDGPGEFLIAHVAIETCTFGSGRSSDCEFIVEYSP